MPIQGIKVYALSCISSKFDEDYTLYYKPNGKRFALLENVLSSESDSNGVIEFSNLTIVGSTDEIVFINFVANGLIKEWSTKDFSLPQPIYPNPIIIDQISAAIDFVYSFPSIIQEGEIIKPLLLSYNSKQGMPMSGYGSVAILTEFCEDIFPYNFVLLTLNRKPKDLLYPMAAKYPSTYENPLDNTPVEYYHTNTSGFIEFDSLQFSTYGNVINGICNATLLFYVGNTRSKEIKIQVRTSVTEVQFERYLPGWNSADKDIIIWKLLNSKGNGVKGKMVNSIEFIYSENDDVITDIELNITNALDTVSDGNGFLMMEYEAIKILATRIGRVKIVIDGISGYSAAISFEYPTQCNSKIIHKVTADWLDISTFKPYVSTYNLCGAKLNSTHMGTLEHKVLTDYGYPSIKPYDDNSLTTYITFPILDPLIGINAFCGAYKMQLLFLIKLYTSSGTILYNIPYFIDVNIPNLLQHSTISFDSSYYNLTQKIYVDQFAIYQANFVINDVNLSLDVPIQASAFPLDTPRSLINMIGRYYFDRVIPVSTDVISYSDSILKLTLKYDNYQHIRQLLRVLYNSNQTDVYILTTIHNMRQFPTY
jgi:hypothetical protein